MQGGKSICTVGNGNSMAKLHKKAASEGFEWSIIGRFFHSMNFENHSHLLWWLEPESGKTAHMLYNRNIASPINVLLKNDAVRQA